MEILAVIASLISTADILLSIKDKLASKENKQHLALWLSELATLVESVAEDLKNGIYPHSKCSQMQFYLTSFHEIVRHDLSKERQDQLYNLMNEAYQVERLLGQLNQLVPEQKEYNLAVMLGAAGHFRGLADYVKLRK